jgi:hypothetical protein
VTTGIGDRYVTTNNIQAALRGRETEILDKLGIPWRRGKPHITCPYPEHADSNPSWRFVSLVGDDRAGFLETLLALARGTADLEGVEVELPITDDPVSRTDFARESWMLG